MDRRIGVTASLSEFGGSVYNLHVAKAEFKKKIVTQLVVVRPLVIFRGVVFSFLRAGYQGS